MSQNLKKEQNILFYQSKGKAWQNIQNDWTKMSQKPKKDALVFFRIKTGLNCLAEHLHRMRFLNKEEYRNCDESTLNVKHQTSCRGLNYDTRDNLRLLKLGIKGSPS